MSRSVGVICGFLGGTIVSVEGGYRVLQHPCKDHVFNRIADARWFLAISWCDQIYKPAGILTHDGKLSFQNQAALVLGENLFLPPKHRLTVFSACALTSGDQTTVRAVQPDGRHLEITGIEIDPRYGKVAIVRTLKSGY